MASQTSEASWRKKISYGVRCFHVLPTVKPTPYAVMEDEDKGEKLENLYRKAVRYQLEHLQDCSGVHGRNEAGYVGRDGSSGEEKNINTYSSYNPA